MFESKRRALIFMLASILFGLAAVYLFIGYVDNLKQSLGDMVPVEVAKSDIPAGVPITAAMVTEQQVPKKYFLASLVGSPDALKGKLSMVPITKGQVITTAMLRDNSLVTGDLRQVQLRAPMAVFDDRIDVLDKVDLVATYDDGQKGTTTAADKRTTEVMLRGVTVNQVSKKGDDIVSVGVIVSLEDAKKLIWTLNFGKELRVLKAGPGKAQKEGGK